MAKNEPNRKRFGEQIREDMMRARQAARADFESYVQEYPWRSVGIAAGVGALVGAGAMMLRRK